MPTLTIITTAGQASRAAVAYGKYLNLGRDATEAEIKADVIRSIRAVVQAQEQQTAIAAIAPATFDPS